MGACDQGPDVPASSPGTPGEDEGEGLFRSSDMAEVHRRTLTLALSRRTGRGEKSTVAPQLRPPQVVRMVNFEKFAKYVEVHQGGFAGHG